MKKTSLRWKTVNFLFLMVTLAFAIGLILCAIFATRFFVNVKQQALQVLYEKMNSGKDPEELSKILSYAKKKPFHYL